jgi:hypothetical protein
LARLLGRSFPEWTTLCGASCPTPPLRPPPAPPERLLKK